jgi:hypothetical protein
VWNEYSQPWSALPRADHGRLVIFIEAGTAAAVDIVRTAVLLKAEEKVLRKALEKARMTARRAMKAVKVFVVKNELVVTVAVAVAVDCCSLGVSVIRKGNSATSTMRELFILVSWLWG